MEVECVGNTQIIHMEGTGITQRTIGLLRGGVMASKVYRNGYIKQFEFYGGFLV
jgi:hypothetical protein